MVGEYLKIDWFVIHDRNLRIAIHHHPLTLFIANSNPRVVNVRILLRIKTHEPDPPSMLGLEHRLFHHLTGRTADMESPHGELRSRLSDRLGSNDADRFSDLDGFTGCEISTVTFYADTTAAFTGQSGTDADLLEA